MPYHSISVEAEASTLLMKFSAIIFLKEPAKRITVPISPYTTAAISIIGAAACASYIRIRHQRDGRIEN